MHLTPGAKATWTQARLGNTVLQDYCRLQIQPFCTSTLEYLQTPLQQLSPRMNRTQRKVTQQKAQPVRLDSGRQPGGWAVECTSASQEYSAACCCCSCTLQVCAGRLQAVQQKGSSRITSTQTHHNPPAFLHSHCSPQHCCWLLVQIKICYAVAPAPPTASGCRAPQIEQPHALAAELC